MSGQTISLRALAGLLAEHVGCGDEAASAFLREFMTVVAQGLKADGYVKIAGLGMFKVNTDVEGKHTVEFAPEAALADKINKPFTIFEPVEVAESLSDEDLKADVLLLNSEPTVNTEPQPEDPAESKPQEPSQDQQDPQESQEQQEPQPQEPTMILPPPVPERLKVNKSEPASAPEPVLEPTPDPEPTLEPELELQPAEEETVADDAPDEKTSVYDSPVSVVLEPESSVTLHRAGHTTLTLVVTAIAACLLGLVCGYLAYRYMNYGLPANVKVLEDGILISRSDDQNSLVDEEIISFEVTDSVGDNASADSATTATQPEVATPAALAVVTDTVSPGNFLTVMARRHYGNPKFWVYIYLENKDKIKDPDSLESGMVVVIPPAEKYGIDSSNPESLKKAEREAYRVLNQ
jgi:nucleoid-associated protein YgaU